MAQSRRRCVVCRLPTREPNDIPYPFFHSKYLGAGLCHRPTLARCSGLQSAAHPGNQPQDRIANDAPIQSILPRRVPGREQPVRQPQHTPHGYPLRATSVNHRLEIATAMALTDPPPVSPQPVAGLEAIAGDDLVLLFPEQTLIGHGGESAGDPENRGQCGDRHPQPSFMPVLAPTRLSDALRLRLGNRSGQLVLGLGQARGRLPFQL
jgi:hypothetical protein